ncbi:MAG: hypothetical protein ACK5M7_07955 [Draconibacterium sp.]
MKYKSLLKLFFLGLCCAVLATSCTKEGPAGLNGENGADGADGSDGTDGVDGIAYCLECHTSGVIDNLTAEWKPSGHGSGGSLARGGSASCAPCHSGVGFVASLDGGEDLSKSSINCTSCHSHGEPPVFQDDNGDPVFIRTTAAVTLMSNSSTIIDLESSSNLCVNCHQPRTAAPVDEDGDGMYLVGSHYGPHHSPQATLLEGIGGYEFPGSATYPGTKSHPHRKWADCVTCHMEDSNHNFSAPEISACTTCHEGATNFDINDKLTGIHTQMEELKTLLEQAGIFEDGEAIEGVSYPFVLAAAAWNYITIEEDKSEGVHNPEYIKALLTNSIEAVEDYIANN